MFGRFAEGNSGEVGGGMVKAETNLPIAWGNAGESAANSFQEIPDVKLTLEILSGRREFAEEPLQTRGPNGGRIVS